MVCKLNIIELSNNTGKSGYLRAWIQIQELTVYEVEICMFYLNLAN